jgi:hypothetical protein
LASQTYFSWQELDIQITKSNLPVSPLQLGGGRKCPGYLASQTYFSWQELDIQITKSNFGFSSIKVLAIWLANNIRRWIMLDIQTPKTCNAEPFHRFWLFGYPALSSV